MARLTTGGNFGPHMATGKIRNWATLVGGESPPHHCAIPAPLERYMFSVLILANSWLVDAFNHFIARKTCSDDVAQICVVSDWISCAR